MPARPDRTLENVSSTLLRCAWIECEPGGHPVRGHKNAGEQMLRCRCELQEGRWPPRLGELVDQEVSQPRNLGHRVMPVSSPRQKRADYCQVRADSVIRDRLSVMTDRNEEGIGDALEPFG
jgi:hypothetical protein